MIPKIYECLSDDYLRPVMNHALINRDDTAATDAYILVVHKSKELFDFELVESLPEDGILVGKEALKDLAMKDVLVVEFNSDLNLIVVSHESKSKPLHKRYFEVKLNGSDFGTYPDYNKVWPKKEKGDGKVNGISFNPTFLERLRRGMGADQGLVLELLNPTKPIVCKDKTEAYLGCKGLIMPMMIS